jgi:signal transduction histidine kinase
MSLSVLRRVESMSRASRDIVNDDMGRRIALNGSGDEFDHLAMSLNAMFDRIQVLMDGLRQVSSDIAHDLRTPLTRLRQRLELAQIQPLDLIFLQSVISATVEDMDAILATFSALLRIAQVEGGAGKAHFKRVDLTEVLRTAIEIYLPALEDKKQRFEAFIPEELRVEGDRELLMQMFANLLENSQLHSPEEANIVMGACVSDAGIIVSLSDNGPGIPQDMREKVLQRFVRLDSSRTTPGNGLGLAMVAAIAALHGASLVLGDNSPGLVVQITLRACA